MRQLRWFNAGATRPTAVLGVALLITVGATSTAVAQLGPYTDAVAGPSLRPEGPPEVGGLKVLSGSLHDHSTDSDGDTPSVEIAQWEFDHRAELGIDFGSMTDHSDFFPAALSATGDLAWPHQGDLTDTYSRDGFTFLRGFEVTNDQENHLNVVGSQNWTDRWTSGEAALRMDAFWTWLSTPPVVDPTGQGLGYGGGDGVGIFNHPSSKGALNFDDFGYNAAADEQMSLIEIFGAQGRDDFNGSDAGWYWFALSQGWTVSPVMDWDFHDWSSKGVVLSHEPGATCGVNGFLPCQRSQVIAQSSTPASLLEAMRNSRTSASQRPDLWATLRGPEGEWQGSTVAAAPGQTITLQVDAGSGTSALTSVDIVSDNGVSPYPYYYGDNVHCEVDGCDPSEFEHSQLTPSYVEQHRRYVASDGHATKKARIGEPPPGTVVASVPLQGARDTATITLQVPDQPGSRPDGKHFFYAVVRAGAPRVWTGPILTSPTGQVTNSRDETAPLVLFHASAAGASGRTMTAQEVDAALARLRQRGARPVSFVCDI